MSSIDHTVAHKLALKRVVMDSNSFFIYNRNKKVLYKFWGQQIHFRTVRWSHLHTEHELSLGTSFQG